MDDTERASCRVCEGTGAVDLKRCAEIVNGRRCRNLARNDPHYFEMFPDRADLRIY